MSASVIDPYGKVRRDIANTLGFKAVGILTVITANINLHTNEFRCSLAALAELAQTSVPTISKYTRELEDTGHIKVSRSGGGNHHEVNVYHLAGKHAETALMAVNPLNPSPKETSQQGLNNLTSGVKKLYTDYIDSLDSDRDEEDNLNLTPIPESDSGEHLTAGEGADKTVETQDSAITLIEEMGITGTALEAAKLYPERIPAALSLSADAKIRNKASYIARILINGEYPDKIADKTPAKNLGNNSWQSDKPSQFSGKSWADFAETNDNNADIPTAISPTFQQPLSPTFADLVPETTDSAWLSTYNQLELQLGKASFDTWLKSSKFIRIEPDGTYIIAVHNSYAKDMLQHRLYRNVKRVLTDVIGKPTELRFVILSEASTT